MFALWPVTVERADEFVVIAAVVCAQLHNGSKNAPTCTYEHTCVI